MFGRDLRLTNLDKVLFPAAPDEAPVTKRELIRYAAQIAPVALPYLSGRALNMHRFPGGADTRASGTSNCPITLPGGCRAGTTPRPGRTRPRPTWS